MKCIVCGCDISKERQEGLEVLGKTDNPTCLEHASNQKVRGIYHGFSGVAPLVIVSDVGTDTTIWREKEAETLEDFSYQLQEED